MKRRGPRIMVIVLISAGLLAAFILTALPGTTRSRLGDLFGRVFDPVVSVFQKSVNSSRAYFGAVSENKRLRDQIARLEEEKAKLNLRILQDEDKIRAYEELKDAFHLVTTFEDTYIQGAAVINRELGPLFDLFRIKAGRLQGLTAQAGRTLPVIDQDLALIGRIHSSEMTSSKVLPLLHEAFAVSARVEGTYRSSFRVRGDLELRQQGLCVADNIAEGTPVRVGDQLVTSGDGGAYPEGIIIGEVVEIRTDLHGKTVTCVVKPAADLDHLLYVFVLMERDHEA